MKGRYEFRVFGADLADLHGLLREALPLQDEGTRTDIYLPKDDPTRVFKLRGGATLDAKCLVERSGAFQRWQPAGMVELPARGRDIAGAFGSLPEMPQLAPDRVYDAGEVAAAFRGLGHRSVRVAKRRFRYDAGSCLAEFAALIVEATDTLHTVAVEGHDLRALRGLRTRLGLEAQDNTSYADMLMTRAGPG